MAAAVALTTLSFAVGVAGDLSLADGPRSGTRVVLRIPPELPADTPRAAPLPVATPAAEAQPYIQLVRFDRIDLLAPLDAPLQEIAMAPPFKDDPNRAPKHESIHAA